MAYDPTFSDACNEYVRARGSVGKTDRFYIERLHAEIGIVKLDRISRRFIDTVITQERQRNGVSESGIRRELNLVQAVLNFAVDNDLTTNAVRVRKTRDSTPRTRWLTAEETETFLMACDPMFRRLAALMFYTGARLSEARYAEWEDVSDGCVVYTSRKGKAQVEKKRSVPLHPRLLEVLQPVHHEGLIAPHFGRVWPRNEIYTQWSKAKMRTFPKMKDLTPHCARHTFASLMIMTGTDGRIVAELLGHASMDMMKRYAHLSTDHLKGAVSLLPLDFDLRG